MNVLNFKKEWKCSYVFYKELFDVFKDFIYFAFKFLRNIMR